MKAALWFADNMDVLILISQIIAVLMYTALMFFLIRGTIRAHRDVKRCKHEIHLMKEDAIVLGIKLQSSGVFKK